MLWKRVAMAIIVHSLFYVLFCPFMASKKAIYLHLQNESYS